MVPRKGVKVALNRTASGLVSLENPVNPTALNNQISAECLKDKMHMGKRALPVRKLHFSNGRGTNETTHVRGRFGTVDIH